MRLRPSIVLCLVLIAFILGAVVARAQSTAVRIARVVVGAMVLIAWAGLASQRVSAQAKDATARMEKLGEGVYAILHDHATLDWPSETMQWPHSNVGVIIGEDGVLVVDSDYLPSRARADIALIRTVTNKPVKYLVNTHWHGDHTHGNGVYRRTFPNLTIVGARENGHFISINQARYASAVLAPASAQRKTLAVLEPIYASGKDTSGRVLSAGERQRLGAILTNLRFELVDIANVEVAPPTMLFDRELELDLGKRRVILHDWGRANSPADVTAYVPDAEVLFTGDIMVSPVPFTGGSYPTLWIDVLKRIEAIPVKAMVPGHGLVQHDHSYTRRLRELMETSTWRMDSMLRAGTGRDSAQKYLNVEDLRANFVKPGDAEAVVLWDDMIKGQLPERVGRCVVGYDC
jgi:glyoxylase-like metal-dependent hydrolase (beta-lactamase superfamily II)